MLFRKFGKTGWDVSVIGQGCWNIGNQWGEMNDATAEAIVKTAYDQGMNLFDTAESYGDPCGLSSIRLGKALANIRDKVYIVDKIGNWGPRPPLDWPKQEIPKNTPEAVRHCTHACVGRLRTTHVDVMLCHKGNITEPEVYIEAFEYLRQEGFIREYGLSTGSLDVLKHFYDTSDGNMSVVEVDYSLLNRQPEADFLPFCKEKNLAVLVRGPLFRGLLSGKYDVNTVFTDSVRFDWNVGGQKREEYEAKIDMVERLKKAEKGMDLVTAALRFTISNRFNTVAIPGATSPAQVRKNAIAGSELLSDSDLGMLDNI